MNKLAAVNETYVLFCRAATVAHGSSPRPPLAALLLLVAVTAPSMGGREVSQPVWLANPARTQLVASLSVTVACYDQFLTHPKQLLVPYKHQGGTGLGGGVKKDGGVKGQNVTIVHEQYIGHN